MTQILAADEHVAHPTRVSPGAFAADEFVGVFTRITLATRADGAIRLQQRRACQDADALHLVGGSSRQSKRWLELRISAFCLPR